MIDQMPDKRWRNQYIDLIGTKRSFVLPCAEGKVSAEDLDFFARKVSVYGTLYLEIGSGSGGHLVEQAVRRPRSLMIGCELRFKRAFRTAQKAEARGIENILVIRNDARSLPALFPTGALDGIFINFPDPWARKKRWRKHRLLQEPYLSRLAGLLKAGGTLSYKTDHRECFDETLELIATIQNMSIQKMTRDLYRSRYVTGNVASEFEQLFRSQDLPIFFLEASKTA